MLHGTGLFARVRVDIKTSEAGLLKKERIMDIPIRGECDMS
jgi:hypothetical protein